jgi:hypothetical protein
MKYRLFKNRIWTSFCVLETFSTNGGGCDPRDRKISEKIDRLIFYFTLYCVFGHKVTFKLFQTTTRNGSGANQQ